jgi:membrane-bound lytic murein transglycosylase A
MDFRLIPGSFEVLQGWKDDDPSSLFSVMARCHRHIESVKPYKTGSLGITAKELSSVFEAASRLENPGPSAARQFFETWFQPFQIIPHAAKSGFVTAFYEPDVAVSSVKSDEWRYPFYRRPPDLVEVDDANRPVDFDSAMVFGRRSPEGVEPYPDRQAIDQGYLDGKGLEIAWAKSRVDVFFAHVQGAARLVYPDGKVRRVTYDGKAGHAFTGIGRFLVDSGEIPIEKISMQAIRAWLAAHPQRESEILWKNRSYIFFREQAVEDARLGPIAAAKVALEPMRSIAVDKTIHTFSTPFFIRSESLTHLSGGKPFERLMMALDTGSAILGPARGDLFTGSGTEAGNLAGTVRNDAEFHILIPKMAARRYG